MQSNADRERELERADGEGKIGMMQRLAGWKWREGVGVVAAKDGKEEEKERKVEMITGI